MIIRFLCHGQACSNAHWLVSFRVFVFIHIIDPPVVVDNATKLSDRGRHLCTIGRSSTWCYNPA